jgi:hypothetical protein
MAAQVAEEPASAVKAEELKAAANAAFQGATSCSFVFLVARYECMVNWRAACIRICWSYLLFWYVTVSTTQRLGKEKEKSKR